MLKELGMYEAARNCLGRSPYHAVRQACTEAMVCACTLTETQEKLAEDIIYPRLLEIMAQRGYRDEQLALMATVNLVDLEFVKFPEGKEMVDIVDEAPHLLAPYLGWLLDVYTSHLYGPV